MPRQRSVSLPGGPAEDTDEQLKRARHEVLQLKHELVAAREEAAKEVAAAKAAAASQVARAHEAAAAEIGAAEANIEEAHKKMAAAQKERREAAVSVERSKKRVSAVYNASQKALVDQVMREREEAHKMAQQEMAKIAEASADDTAVALVAAKAQLEASQEELSGMKLTMAQLSSSSEEESRKLRRELAARTAAAEAAEATLAQAVLLSQKSQEVTVALMAQLNEAKSSQATADGAPSVGGGVRRPSVHTPFDDGNDVDGAGAPAAAPPASVSAPGWAAQSVDLESIGYMGLKKLVVTHGVPMAEASARPTKAGLVELAVKHGARLTFTHCGRPLG